MDTSMATSFLPVILDDFLPDLLVLDEVELPSVDVETDCNPVKATAAAALMASFFSWLRATGGGFMVVLLFMAVAGTFIVGKVFET